MTRLLSFLIPVLFSISSSFGSYLEVEFKHSTIQEAQSEISSSGKYALIYFTADWCMPCQILRESHFRDERVINQINNGYISVEADYSEIDHIEWYDRYEVRSLPTLLVIDENGNELDRIQNIRDTRHLYLFLHNHSKVSSQQVGVEKPMAYKLNETYTPESQTTKRHKELITNNQDSNLPKVKLVSNISAKGKNIYAVDVASYKHDLSIQFAAYTRYRHALKYLHELQKEGLSVSILEEYVKGKKYFKVVQQAPKSEISSLYNKYKSEGKDCFIRPATIKS